jgi:hypothetical protein
MATFRSRDAGRGDVRKHQDLLAGEISWVFRHRESMTIITGRLLVSTGRPGSETRR